jgi:hypothetical protein
MDDQMHRFHSFSDKFDEVVHSNGFNLSIYLFYKEKYIRFIVIFFSIQFQLLQHFVILIPFFVIFILKYEF